MYIYIDIDIDIYIYRYTYICMYIYIAVYIVVHMYLHSICIPLAALTVALRDQTTRNSSAGLTSLAIYL